MHVKLQQHKELPKKQNIDKYSNWVMVLPLDINQSRPYATLLSERRKKTGNKKPKDGKDHTCDETRYGLSLLIDYPDWNEWKKRINTFMMNRKYDSSGSFDTIRKHKVKNKDYITNDVQTRII